MNDNNQMASHEEIIKLCREWGDALTLAETYQELASKARSKYEAAKATRYCNCDEPKQADENWNLQADIAPATVEDLIRYIADRETDDV